MAVTALTRQDRILNGILYVVLSLILAAVAYPLFFVLIASVSDPVLVNTGKVWIIPRGLTLDGYARIVQHDDLLRGYRNSLAYASVGTLLNLGLTLTAAYALSRRDLPGRNGIMLYLTFTMFFSGGLIPTFLLIRDVGLYNTFWIMILPAGGSALHLAVSVFNIIIARTFFMNTIPQELLDAAVMDGCSDLRFFRSVVLPLSGAIVAVLMVFYAVGHWNGFFHGLIYLRERERFPLQLILRDILIQNTFTEELEIDDENALAAMMLAESIKYGMIIVASVPVLILYPFVQKHYVRGVMIGAIKG
ncbi:MAG: carbohydrate ABC transporter permease [Spirochaetaceae bacterium]|nr:carbohydrate ABC transporter permease [Spirochaetaceae bacterium]